MQEYSFAVGIYRLPEIYLTGICILREFHLAGSSIFENLRKFISVLEIWLPIVPFGYLLSFYCKVAKFDLATLATYCLSILGSKVLILGSLYTLVFCSE